MGYSHQQCSFDEGGGNPVVGSRFGKGFTEAVNPARAESAIIGTTNYQTTIYPWVESQDQINQLEYRLLVSLVV